MTATASIAIEFEQTLDEIVALFFDARSGFLLNNTRIVKAQEQVVAANPNDPEVNTIDALDAGRRHYYGTGEPWAPGSRIQHVSTQGAFKARNAEDGTNSRVVGNLCTVAIYSMWEDEYRGAIAASMKLASNHLLVPVFGDIRHFRNSIIHHRGIAKNEVERCELLKWFKPGETIFINEVRFDQMIHEIATYLGSLHAA